MNVVEQLRREEGVRPSAYQDHLGFWTIGVGRLIDSRKGGGLSAAEIDLLLTNDVNRCTAGLREALPWFDKLNDARQAVLIGMAFQMGLAGLLEFKRTLGSVEDGQYGEAAVEMLQSTWAKQTPFRAMRMATQMETGEWQA